ncbi:MAG: hypothetical protein F9K40_01215 [Kofleriaceae bacterium]|nr:MAG: hypothetical protein F9K40_01215 [Kofleriaceae bacterium]MBZ0232380.1 hypothetical protein [Kofleriaceae bacterium]
MFNARVASLLIVGVSCGQRVERTVPVHAPPPPTHSVSVAPTRLKPPVPHYLVGEVCSTAAQPTYRYFPLFARSNDGWTDDQSVARAPLTEAPQHFSVLGFDGERHGKMLTAVERTPTDPRGFAGDYRGVWSVGPCGFRRPDGVRGVTMGCVNAGGCGIAAAVAARTGPPPEPPEIERSVKELCVANGALIGDLDGDGTDEAFPLNGFREQEEIAGTPYEGAPCKGQFAWYRIQLGTDILDVLGAVDLDQDGHLELLTALTTEAGSRSVALYTPASAPALRLDRRAVVVR